MVRVGNEKLGGICDVRYAIWDWKRAVVRSKLVLLFALLVIHPRLCAQEVTVTARVDSNNILIGDWLHLHVEVHHSENQSVALVAIPDSLAGFEILRRDSIVKRSADHDIVETTTWTITSYDSGTFVIPPLRVQYTIAGDTLVHGAESSPIPVFVHSVGVDTSQAIKDIKPPISLGISFSEMLPYLIGIVLLAAVVWLIVYFMRKRKRGESIIPEPPPRPAHETALEALRSLESEKYWQRGKVKEYHSKLTDIIRLYIERKFAVMALEMITDDILDAAGITNLDAAAVSHLKEILTLADLVKFAKLQPLAEENERSMASAYSFVEATKEANTHRPHAEIQAEVGV